MEQREPGEVRAGRASKKAIACIFKITHSKYHSLSYQITTYLSFYFYLLNYSYFFILLLLLRHWQNHSPEPPYVHSWLSLPVFYPPLWISPRASTFQSLNGNLWLVAYILPLQNSNSFSSVISYSVILVIHHEPWCNIINEKLQI